MTKAITSEVMTKEVETIHEDETVDAAARRLANENVGALPIVDKQKHIKGILTDRDIVVNVLARGRDPKTTRVRELEIGEVYTVTPSDSVERAGELMAKHKVRRIPVVERGAVVGIISSSDVARTADPDFVVKVFREILTH